MTALERSTGKAQTLEDSALCFPICAISETCVLTAIAADIISAIEFDASGQHLATGDRGGRVVLFERVASQGVHLSHTPSLP